jgi:hypothetical protein
MLEKEMSRQDARIKKQEKQVARSSRFHEMQVTCRFPHCIGHQGALRREAGGGNRDGVATPSRLPTLHSVGMGGSSC